MRMPQMNQTNQTNQTNTQQQPSKTVQVYAINKIKTLIELNGDAVNFHLGFSVKGTTPFSMAIVDQSTLNEGQSINYQEIKTGEISGELSWERNIYAPYFMVLKSSQPTEVTVEITITRLPVTADSSPITSSSDIKNNKSNNKSNVNNKEESAPETTTSQQYVYVSIGLVIAVGILYYLFIGKSGKSERGTSLTGRPSLLTKLKQLQNITPP